MWHHHKPQITLFYITLRNALYNSYYTYTQHVCIYIHTYIYIHVYIIYATYSRLKRKYNNMTYPQSRQTKHTERERERERETIMVMCVLSYYKYNTALSLSLPPSLYYTYIILLCGYVYQYLWIVMAAFLESFASISLLQVCRLST